MAIADGSGGKAKTLTETDAAVDGNRMRRKAGLDGLFAVEVYIGAA
jgi:hypothetical protein